ncbi:MAG TPA: hypothetical protein VJU82_07665 [Acidobacteriaceae bacterium]|nr:hypothetical protein [Acidobacteriaceae bacterium]
MPLHASEIAAPTGMAAPAVKAFARRDSTWHLPALLLGASAYLALNLFRFFQAPFLLSGDQIFFWMFAQRMLAGEKIYRDFFQYTAPGTDLIYLALFKLFGPHIWVTNAIVFALGLALCWICFSVAKEIMDRSSAALAAALFLVLIYGKLLSATHYLFSALAIMCAVKVMMTETTPARSLGAGVLLGLASFFTQSHGAIALMGMLLVLACEAINARGLLPSRVRASALLLLGYSAALLLLSAHWIASEGVPRLWHFQVTYVREYLNLGDSGGFLGLPPLTGKHAALKLSQYVAVYLLVATVYPLTLWRCWEERKNPRAFIKRPALLLVIGTVLLLAMASNPNWLRVYTASMPAVILFIWLVTSGRLKRRAVLATIWAAIGCLTVSQIVGRYRTQSTIVRLPAGAAAVEPLASDKLVWMMHHSAPGDYFFQAAWPGFYLPLALRNPAYLESVEPSDRLTPADVSALIDRLDEKQVAYVQWPQRLDHPNQTANGSQDNIQPLRNYLHTHYTVVKVFADGDSILKRNSN